MPAPLRTLLATAVALLLLAAPAGASTNRYLNEIRDDPIALHEFMRALPKGGDIHNHLSGAIYAESMIGWGAADGLCIETEQYFSSFPPCTGDQVPIANALTNNILYNEIVAAWSMRDFVPGPGLSGHDHFFASFDKFSATQSQHKGDALAEVATRAESQSEHYLELLYTAQFSRVNALANQVGLSSDFGATRDALLAGGHGPDRRRRERRDGRHLFPVRQPRSPAAPRPPKRPASSRSASTTRCCARCRRRPCSRCSSSASSCRRPTRASSA